MHWRIKAHPQGLLGKAIGFGGEEALPVLLHESLTESRHVTICHDVSKAGDAALICPQNG